MEEELCARLGFAAAGAQEFSRFEMRLVAGEIASAGPKLCEESQLATWEYRVKAGESKAGRRGGDGAKFGASG